MTVPDLGRHAPRLLGATAFCLLGAVVVPLQTASAPHGVLSFELAGTPERLAQIVWEWRALDRVGMAIAVQVGDAVFPVLYTAAGVAAVQRWGWGASRFAAAVLVLAGVLDACVENPILDLALLAEPPPEPWPAVAAGAARVKFASFALALLVAWLGGEGPSAWERLFGPSAAQLQDRLLAGAAPVEVLARARSTAAAEGAHGALRELSLTDRLADGLEITRALVGHAPRAALPWAVAMRDQGHPGASALVDEAARAMLVQTPGSADALEALAAGALRDGRLADAVAWLDRGDPTDARLQLVRVSWLRAVRRSEEARELLSRLHALAAHRVEREPGPYWPEVYQLAEGLRLQLLDEVGPGTQRLPAVADVRIPELRRATALLHAGSAPVPWATGPLQPVHVALRQAEDTLARGPSTVARLRRGESNLRLLDLREARRDFGAILEETPDCWPAGLGLAAVELLQRADPVSALRDLPDAPWDPRWDPILPDRAALTMDERRVVAASLRGLEASLPGLLAAGARIRLLPLDVRAADLAEFQGAPALAEGLAARSGLAVARVELLLATAGDCSWVFAHEAAHLAFFFLDEARKASFLALHDEVRGDDWAFTGYQHENVDEFFAVAWEDALRERHGPRDGRPRPAAWRRVQAWFTELAAAEGRT